MTVLQIDTPEWSLPLLEHARFKGAKGGRSSGKSHERAEAAVEAIVMNPDCKIVCIREIQKSLKFSAKALIESKIRKMGVSHLFEITVTEIRRQGRNAMAEPATGIIIFQGMQDHTADSIKSLEGFDIAWCEEAQSLSKRSIELLVPTIRKDGSELWFTWNPDQPEDAVEELFKDNAAATVVHVNFTENPFCPEVMKEEAARMLKKDPEAYNHVWLGGFNVKSDSQIFKGRWRVDDFEPENHWNGPYYGMDFGFSNDPTVMVRCWINDNRLMIDIDSGQTNLDLDRTASYFTKADPQVVKHTIRADSARPESISFLKRHGLPYIEAVKKWPNSVEDGIEFLKTFDEIVIHERCEHMQQEARLYSYKIDKKTGDILPVIIDEFNHRWDAVRYALAPLIKQNTVIFEAL